MQHSVKDIGRHRESLSSLRKDLNMFNAQDFFQFAKVNMSKYGIIENSDDLLTDHGDPKVGIIPQTWRIPCPFSTHEVDREGLQYFATEIGKLYAEFSESGNVECDYDYELYYPDTVEDLIKLTKE